MPGSSTISVFLVAATAVALVACGGSIGRGTPVPTGRETPQPTATARPSEPTATPSPAATVAPTAVSAGTATPAPTASPSAVTPTPTRTPVVGEPVATITSELTLDLFGLGEETVVRGTSIVVAGRTRPNAVLSINEVIIPLGSDGRFEVTVGLKQGPNLIEVVVSDLAGAQVSRILAVIALPEA